MIEQRFAPALRKVHRLLKAGATELQIPIQFALIGGLAVSTWGAIRATRDIDLLADSDPSPIRDHALRGDLKKFFERKRCAAEWREGDFDDPIALLLHLRLGKQSADAVSDILWASKRWQRDALQRRVEITSGRQGFFVLAPEDLILMKLDAGGPQDLLDVQALLSCRPPELNIARLKRSATRIRLRKLLDNCLRETGTKDPRQE